MSWLAVGAIAGAVITLLLVGLVVLLRGRSRSRTELLAMLESAQREADDLRLRLDIAHARLEGHTGARRQANSPEPTSRTVEYLITDAGTPAVLFDPDGSAQSPNGAQLEVPDRLVLSATLGAPLVKVAAFTHGLGRALSAESRNRIWFEMRREVRAARKRRRRLLKEYSREMRAAERAGEVL